MSHPDLDLHRARAQLRSPSLVRAVSWTVGAAVMLAAALLAEVLWVLRRPLPTLTGLDVSRSVAGVGGGAGAQQPPLRILALGDSSLTGPGLARAEEVWLHQALDRRPLRR